MTKSKETVRPEKLEFDVVTRSIYKVHRGDFDELEVEGFLRERFPLQKCKLIVN